MSDVAVDPDKPDISDVVCRLALGMTRKKYLLRVVSGGDPAPPLPLAAARWSPERDVTTIFQPNGTVADAEVFRRDGRWILRFLSVSGMEDVAPFHGPLEHYNDVIYAPVVLPWLVAALRNPSRRGRLLIPRSSQ